METIWRDCPGAETRYEVSSDGRVRRKSTGKILLGGYTDRGYHTVHITSDAGKNKPWRVHQLVAKAFPDICGEWFDGAQVDHLNADKKDNRAANLKVCTAKENCNNPNMKEFYKKAKPPVRRGRENNRSRTIGKYTISGALMKVFETGREAAKEIGVCPASICLNANGLTKTCHGFVYKFMEGE